MTQPSITNELLHDLIAEPLSVIELCTRHALTIDELHDIVISPPFERIAQMVKTIQRARENFTLTRIAEVLERIALSEPTTPSHTETIRKAAAHLDRQLRKNSTKTGDPTPDPAPDDAVPDDPQPAPQSPQDTEPTPPASPTSDHADLTTNHPHAPTTRPNPNAPP